MPFHCFLFPGVLASSPTDKYNIHVGSSGTMTLLSGSLSLMQVNEKYWRSPKPLELYYLLDRPEELQSSTPQPLAAQAPTSQLTTVQPPAPQTSEWCQEWLLQTLIVKISKDRCFWFTDDADFKCYRVLCSFCQSYAGTAAFLLERIVFLTCFDVM